MNTTATDKGLVSADPLSDTGRLAPSSAPMWATNNPTWQEGCGAHERYSEARFGVWQVTMTEFLDDTGYECSGPWLSIDSGDPGEPESLQPAQCDTRAVADLLVAWRIMLDARRATDTR